MDEYLSSFSLNLFYNMRKVEEHKLNVNKPFPAIKNMSGKRNMYNLFKKKNFLNKYTQAEIQLTL